MKEYVLLYCSNFDNYAPIEKKRKRNSLSQLLFVLFSDFRPWDNNFLTQMISCYNASFIYHDFKNKMLYMGYANWEIDEDIMCPEDEEFPNYVNDTNSCKMSVDNFIELRKQWMQLQQNPLAFAIIYRDELDWIHCQGFNSKEEMELFIQNYETQTVH